MDTQEQIREFLDGSPHAVVGASRDRSKYGNKCLRAYLQNEMPVFPINPAAGEIEGQAAYADLASVPETPHGISIVTPPEITEAVVREATALGIRHLWMQPGAESDAAVAEARKNGMNVIAGGPCLLVALRYRER